MGHDTPADFTDDLIYADGIAIQISINDSNWFEPNFEASGSTDANRWYTGVEDDFAEISEYSFALRNLPLTNEASPPVSAETYYLRFKYKRKSGSAAVYSTSWSSSVAVVCTATGATDIVANAIHQATIDMSDWLTILEGPVAYWSLNDVGLDQVDFQFKDNSGNGHHATANQLLTEAEGPAGPCPTFAAQADYLTVAHAADLNLGTGAFTIIGWLNTNVNDANNHFILTNRSSGASEGFILYQNASNYQLYFSTWNGASFDIVSSDATLTIGDWTPFAVTRSSGGLIRMYIGGDLQADTETNAATMSTSDPWYIGQDSDVAATDYWDGELAHIRIYNSELGQGAIKWLMQNPTGNIPSMVLADTVGAGQIFAEHVSVITQEKVNNPTVSGHLGGWGAHDENGANNGATILSMEDVTYDGQTIKAARLTSAVNYGVRLKSFPFSNNKIYKISFTVKSSAADGVVYVGSGLGTAPTDGSEAAGVTHAGALDVIAYNGDDYTATPRSAVPPDANRYFLDGIAASTSWQTWTMYLIGMDRSIDECQKSEGTNFIGNYTFHEVDDSRATHFWLRILLWGMGASRYEDYINFSVTEVGSGTVVASNISVTNLSAINANLGVLSDGGKIGADANNYWNLDTGVFRVGDATNYMYYDGAGSLSLRLTTFKVTTDLTRVKGVVEISDEGDIDSGLTDPLTISATTVSPNKEHTIDASASSLRLHLALGGTDILTLYDGNVGIGTVIPSELLHVKNSSGDAQGLIQGSTFSVLTLQSGDDNNYAYVNLGASTGYGWQIGKDIDAGVVAEPNAFYIYELTTGDVGTRFTISKGGNVGIGTINPGCNLHVLGGGSAISPQAGVVATFQRTTDSTAGSYVAIIGGNSTGLSCLFLGDTDDEDIGQVRYNHNVDSMQFYTNASVWATIDSVGQVGLGRVPLATLDVYKASAIASLIIESGGAYDATIHFDESGTTGWIMGIDYSDGQRFKLSLGDAFDTDDFIQVDRNGNIFFEQDTVLEAYLTCADRFHIMSNAYWTGTNYYSIETTQHAVVLGIGEHAEYALELLTDKTIGGADELLSLVSVFKIGLSGGIRDPHNLHGASVTENTIFDTLGAFIPNTNDEMLITGALQIATTRLVISKVIRLDSDTVRFYGYDVTNSSFTTVDCDNGDATLLQGISIAW
tara:strand:- start:11180 stop:14686 length:3507 start_codon:yes stop_codon:yes gene_type:complete